MESLGWTLMERIAHAPGGALQLARMAEIDQMVRRPVRRRAVMGFAVLCGVVGALQVLDPFLTRAGSFIPVLALGGEPWRVVTANFVLTRVQGSGRKGRIVKGDVQAYVKQALAQGSQPAAPSGFAVPEMPDIDFSKWGEIELRPLNKLRRVSARNLHRAWLTVPHVTQFDESDITELEAFRQAAARPRPRKRTAYEAHAWWPS